MKLIKKVSSLLVVLTVGVGVFVGCGNKSSEKGAIDIIKERGTIKVGVFSDKPPFGYVDANGENQGYDVFIAKKLAKDLLGDESKVEFVLSRSCE